MTNDVPTVSSVKEGYEEVFEILPQKKSERPKVEQMFNGQTGFVRSSALFNDDDKKLHLMASAELSRLRSREFFIKIKKEDGLYLVEKKSLEKDSSNPGYFGKKVKRLFIPVKIVKVLEKTVADMVEGEIGFVRPSSITLVFYGRYYINSKAVFYSKVYLSSDLKIKRVGDIIMAENNHIKWSIEKEPSQKMPVNFVKEIK